MYAVIRTGGKQYRVEEGETLDVELIGEVGSSIELTPVMVVDGDSVLATPDQLEAASVSAEVVDRVKGVKINAFTYKNKSNVRRRWGHRQQYNSITITGISKG
ncbi:MAG: 50S ribosomal protein L21 [Acidimicrobiales bacterium]